MDWSFVNGHNPCPFTSGLILNTTCSGTPPLPTLSRAPVSYRSNLWEPSFSHLWLSTRVLNPVDGLAGEDLAKMCRMINGKIIGQEMRKHLEGSTWKARIVKGGKVIQELQWRHRKPSTTYTIVVQCVFPIYLVVSLTYCALLPLLVNLEIPFPCKDFPIKEVILLPSKNILPNDLLIDLFISLTRHKGTPLGFATLIKMYDISWLFLEGILIEVLLSLYVAFFVLFWGKVRIRFLG